MGMNLLDFPLIAGRRRATAPAAGAALPGHALSSIRYRPPGMPETGSVYHVNVPGVASGFAGRPGDTCPPPAYLALPRPQLPGQTLPADGWGIRLLGSTPAGSRR